MNSRKQRAIIKMKKYAMTDVEQQGLNGMLSDIRALREKAVTKVDPIPP